MFTAFLVPIREVVFPKSSFNLKFAKVYFCEISEDKESNNYVMKYSMTTTLSNYVTTSIFMEDSEESFEKWKNS